MKLIHSVLMVFILITFSACARDAFKECFVENDYDGLSEREFTKLLNEYGGTYVFDEKLRDEIRQLAETRRKHNKWLYYEISTNAKELDENIKKYGHEAIIFGISSKGYNTYLEKIREYIGDDEIFEKFKPYFKITQYYKDDKNNIIPITIMLTSSKQKSRIKLSGDEGSGMRFCESYSVPLRKTDNFFYLTNNKFIKGERK